MRHLDTNIVIAVLNGVPQAVDRFRDRGHETAVSALVLAELNYGFRNSDRPDQNFERLRQMLSVVEVVQFDEACADAYGRIRLNLKRKGRPCGYIDNLIAATALAKNATLVTHNTKHFADVDGLTVEDWLS